MYPSRNILLAALALVAAMCSFVACDQLRADEPRTISLTSAETKEAQQIAEARQQIAVDRQKAQADFQTQLDRLNEQDQDLNVKNTALCFRLKKAHQLRYDAQYVLDEWRGELRKL